LSWNTVGLSPGAYRINVWVRDVSSAGTDSNAYGSWDAYNAGFYYTLTAGCPSVSVTGSPPDGAMISTNVSITPSAPGCPNPQYELWILDPGASLYRLVQPYAAGATMSWSTTGLAPGTYRINVWVRDANGPGVSSNAYGSWDAYDASLYYTLTAGCPSVTVSTTSSSTSVTITSAAPGCPQPRYEIWILYPGASLYTLVQSYSSSGSYVWSTTGLPRGTYRINVWVRDAASPGTYGNAWGTYDNYNAAVYVALN
jgi:hypothetical protein